MHARCVPAVLKYSHIEEYSTFGRAAVEIKTEVQIAVDFFKHYLIKSNYHYITNCKSNYQYQYQYQQGGGN